MLQPSPAGGSGELFPSPAKGDYDNPGLSSAQGADAQALVDAALGGYYTRGETNDLLAGKEPAITEGSLAQTLVRNLTSDLAARATTQQLNDALAGKHPLLTSESALAVDTLSARGLNIGTFVGIGIPLPQAALDVNGSILASAGLRVGNIDVIERLFEHTTTFDTISTSHDRCVGRAGRRHRH